MALKSENQKIKLLKIMELLNEKTDEEHPLSTQEMIDELAKLDISCDRRTLYRDIDYLNENGYDILERRKGHYLAYYIEDRTLTNEDLRILVDAVQAAAFIPRNKTDEMVERIAKLSSTHAAEILKRNDVVNYNPNKHTNKSIFYTVNSIESAIHNKQQIQFRYFSFDNKHRKVYRDDGAFRTANPLALVLRDANYYLVTYNDRKKDEEEMDFRNYRVDRMDNVTVIDSTITPEAEILLGTEELKDHVHASFQMFGGDTQQVSIVFTGDLLNPIYDRFGEDVKIYLYEDKFNVRVKVNVSDIFFGWIAEFGGKMNIRGPRKVKEDYRKYLKKLLKSMDNI